MSQLIGYLDAPPQTAAAELEGMLTVAIFCAIYAIIISIAVPVGVAALCLQAIYGK